MCWGQGKEMGNAVHHCVSEGQDDETRNVGSGLRSLHSLMACQLQHSSVAMHILSQGSSHTL